MRLFLGRGIGWCCLLLAAVLGPTGVVWGQEDGNLLLNGGFEERFVTADVGDVAVGWTPFWVIDGLDNPDNDRGRVPEYMDGMGGKAPAVRAYSGGHSLLWHTKFSTAFAGVYQQVPVGKGTSLKLRAWGYGWSSVGGDVGLSEEAAWVRQRVGIDPTGGTDPLGLTVIWSLPHQFVDEWGELAVEATAEGEHVTVFLAAYPNEVRPQNDFYFDEVVLRPTSYDLPVVEPRAVAAPEERVIDPILLGLVEEMGTGPGQMGLRGGVVESGPVWRVWLGVGLFLLGCVCLMMIWMIEKRGLNNDR